MALPTPEAGLVIAYAYLWHHKHMAGREEGRKNCPIVLAVRNEDVGSVIVTVLPITHSAPDNPVSAVEIPLPVRRHLRLDDAPSWAIVAQGNEFVWPGFDLRKVSNTSRYDYGFLPPRFFSQIVRAFDACRVSGKARLTPRE